MYNCYSLFIQNIMTSLTGFNPRQIFHNQLTPTKFIQNIMTFLTGFNPLSFSQPERWPNLEDASNKYTID